MLRHDFQSRQRKTHVKGKRFKKLTEFIQGSFIRDLKRLGSAFEDSTA